MNIVLEQALAALAKARDISSSVRNDPAGAARRVGDIADLLSLALPQLSIAQACTRIVVPTLVQSVTNDSGTGPTTTDPIQVKFPTKGTIIGIAGVCAEDNSLRSSLSMALLFDGVNSTITTGFGEGYLSLAMLSPSFDASADYFAFNRPVTPDQRVSVKFTSQAPKPAVTWTRTPLVAFMVLEDVPGGTYGV